MSDGRSVDGKDGWTNGKRALLALLVLCDEADREEALSQFPQRPGGPFKIKRRAAEWLAEHLSLRIRP